MNTMNAYALYFGKSLYKENLDYVTKLKELMDKSNEGCYPIVKTWRENYPELASAYDKAKVSEGNVEDDILFMDFFNELRIAANKEYLSKLVM